MTRTNRDFYPTPPCAAMAFGEWLRGARSLEQKLWCDPAAGFGTLLEWAGIPRENRRALELGTEPFLLEELGKRVSPEHAVTGVDALVAMWPDDCHIIANPPFCDLEEFVRRGVAHHERIMATDVRHVLAVLTPVGFWHSKSRLDIADPNHVLALTWRPDFLRADTGTFQDFVWAVWGIGKVKTRWHRLERPAVPQSVTDEHDRLARLAAGRAPANQLALEMGAA